MCPRYPPQTGGVEAVVRELSVRLAERGHEVVVRSADAGGEGRRRERRDGVKVRRHRALAPGGAFHVAPGLVRGVRRTGADVVHAHNYHALPLAFAATAVDDERFVATTHYHGASASWWRDRLLHLYRPFGRRALARADAVVAVSDWERRRLADDLGVPSAVIPNGLERARFETTTPLERPRPYLLCVGRLEAYKGVQHVIRALARIEGYDLLVAGEGSHREALEDEARRLGVEDRVEWLGYVEDERLPSLYRGASAYVSLSSLESHGLTVAEALASGTPCVVRRGSGLEGWVEHAGVVGVSAVDPGTVGDAIRDAVDRTPDGAGLLDWETVVDRYVALYTGEQRIRGGDAHA